MKSNKETKKINIKRNFTFKKIIKEIKKISKSKIKNKIK